MIKMRSSPNNKITKPPPPVPPRPSKNVVAEALAKTRKPTENSPPSASVVVETIKPAGVIIKTQSYYPVNYCHIKPKQDDPPSIAVCYEPPKPVARTIIYQSNASVTTVVNSTKVQESLPINECLPITSNTKLSISPSRTDSFKSKSSGSPQFEIITTSSDSAAEDQPKNWNDILNDRNHVNTLIDEMFASVLDQPSNDLVETVNDTTVVDKKMVTFNEESSAESNTSTQERKNLRNDRQNHEQLIAELANMKQEKNINKRQRKPSKNEETRIQHSDWVEVTKTGQEVRLSSCQITIDNKLSTSDEERSSVDSVISRCTNMSSSNMQGLPPLPKSLSGFSIMMENSGGLQLQLQQPGRMQQHVVYPQHPPAAVLANGDSCGSLKKDSNLESKLALLRREMYSLRQLDLSLLSQLWSLNESIQDFRQILQDNEVNLVLPGDDLPLSPPTPSPTPSSGEAEEDDDDPRHLMMDNDEDEEEPTGPLDEDSDGIEDEDDDSAAPFFTPRAPLQQQQQRRYRPAPPPPSVGGGGAGGGSSSGTSSV